MPPTPANFPEIPVLETARLRLRGHTPADLPACCALWADPQVTRYIGGRPQSAEETWARLLRYSGHWALLGFGYWLVEEKATGEFVGEVGLADYRREIHPPLGAAPEIGWVLSPANQGKGYAAEAIAAVLGWFAQQRFPANEVVCLIHPENLASLRLAAKLGFRELDIRMYKGSPAIVLAWSADGEG